MRCDGSMSSTAWLEDRRFQAYFLVTLQALLRWFLHFGLRRISLPTPEPAAHLIRPEGFKSVRRHRRVAHGVLNVLVSQIVLNRSGIMPVSG
jgi:hypothetical protein